ncbi:hypothetical protein KY284_036128 [Solanum tuberosum]|nr:hypothetical protein KY284_036128 [Solanum tuberosum]
MRQERSIEGALQAKLQNYAGIKNKKIKGKKNYAENNQVSARNGSSQNSSSNRGEKFPLCQYCGRKNHPRFKCRRKPDMRFQKCQKLGHAEIIYKEKGQQQQGEAQVANQHEEEQLFFASCFASSILTDIWLIDSGCTNHMTSDEKLSKRLNRTATSRVMIGNGDYLQKGTVATESYTDKVCLIIDPSGQKLFRIKMQGKSFSLNPMEEEQIAFPSKSSVAETWHKRLGHFHHRGL